MSIEAIRCPGCKNLVNVKNLEQHYRTDHAFGIEPGATTITSANPHDSEIPAWARTLVANTPHPGKKPHLFDSPVWGPLLRRLFPHILFGAFVIGAIVGILAW